MSLHVIFIDNQGIQLSDVTSNFTSVTIPSNAFIMRICDDTKSYSNSTLTKLFEIDNTFYSKVLEYTTKGDYPFIDISVSDFGGFTAIFNQLSAQFVGNDPPQDIYDFTGYGGSGSGGSIDFSTIVTALNSITTALSSLTNLSNLSNLSQLANIITAIQNKDNQTDLVNQLQKCFFYTDSSHNQRSIFTGLTNNVAVSGTNAGYAIIQLLNRIRNSFLSFNPGVTDDVDVQHKPVCALSSLSSSRNSISSIMSQSNILSISDRLQNIESKLEQNLPFATLTDVTLNVDTVKKVVTQELNEKE